METTFRNCLQFLKIKKRNAQMFRLEGSWPDDGSEQTDLPGSLTSSSVSLHEPIFRRFHFLKIKYISGAFCIQDDVCTCECVCLYMWVRDHSEESSSEISWQMPVSGSDHIHALKSPSFCSFPQEHRKEHKCDWVLQLSLCIFVCFCLLPDGRYALREQGSCLFCLLLCPNSREWWPAWVGA